MKTNRLELKTSNLFRKYPCKGSSVRNFLLILWNKLAHQILAIVMSHKRVINRDFAGLGELKDMRHSSESSETGGDVSADVYRNLLDGSTGADFSHRNL